MGTEKKSLTTINFIVSSFVGLCIGFIIGFFGTLAIFHAIDSIFGTDIGAGYFLVVGFSLVVGVFSALIGAIIFIKIMKSGSDHEKPRINRVAIIYTLFIIILIALLWDVNVSKKKKDAESFQIISPKNGEEVSGMVDIKMSEKNHISKQRYEFYVKNDFGEKSIIGSGGTALQWNSSHWSNGPHTLVVVGYPGGRKTVDITSKNDPSVLPKIKISSPKDGETVEDKTKIAIDFTPDTFSHIAVKVYSSKNMNFGRQIKFVRNPEDMEFTSSISKYLDGEPPYTIEASGRIKNSTRDIYDKITVYK